MAKCTTPSASFLRCKGRQITASFDGEDDDLDTPSGNCGATSMTLTAQHGREAIVGTPHIGGLGAQPELDGRPHRPPRRKRRQIPSTRSSSISQPRASCPGASSGSSAMTGAKTQASASVGRDDAGAADTARFSRVSRAGTCSWSGLAVHRTHVAIDRFRPAPRSMLATARPGSVDGVVSA
jgi:hypothetical protein